MGDSPRRTSVLSSTPSTHRAKSASMNTRVVLTIGALIVALATLAPASPIPNAPQDGIVPEVEAAQEAATKWLPGHDHDYDPDLEHAAETEDSRQTDKMKDQGLATNLGHEAKDDNAKVVKDEAKDEQAAANEAAEEKRSEAAYVHRTSLIEACYAGDGCVECMKKCPDCQKANPALKWPHIPFRPNAKCNKCASGQLDAYSTAFGIKWGKDDCLKCTRCHSMDEKPPKCFAECRAILTVCPVCESAKKDIEDHFHVGMPHFTETASQKGYKCSQCASNADNVEIQQSLHDCKICHGIK